MSQSSSLSASSESSILDDIGLNVSSRKEVSAQPVAIEPPVKKDPGITDQQEIQNKFSLSALCSPEEKDTQKQEDETDLAAKNTTLLLSWKYDGEPPAITREIIEDAFRKLEIPSEVLRARSFQHKIYIDCSVRVTKPQFAKICRYMEKQYANTSFFMRYDVASNEDQTTVFLGNLIGITAADLAEAIEKRLGFVPKVVRILIDKETGKPKPIAYVVCDTRQQAEDLASGLRGVKLGLSSGIRTDLLVHDGDSRVTLKPRNNHKSGGYKR